MVRRICHHLDLAVQLPARQSSCSNRVLQFSFRGRRRRRGWSQLELSGRAGTSQRHLAFLELERASPCRDMVARLAKALDLPLRQQNALLLAAGFAPVWRETDPGAPELGAVREALD